MLLKEGHRGRGAAGYVLVDELHELADEGGQVAGGLPVVLKMGTVTQGSAVLVLAQPPSLTLLPGRGVGGGQISFCLS